MIYTIGVSIFLPAGIVIMKNEPLAMPYALAFAQMFRDIAAASLAARLAPVKDPVLIGPVPIGIMGLIQVTDLAASLPVVVALLRRYRIDDLADVAWQRFGVNTWHHYAGKQTRPFEENFFEAAQFAQWIKTEKLGQ